MTETIFYEELQPNEFAERLGLDGADLGKAVRYRAAVDDQRLRRRMETTERSCGEN